MDFGSIGRHFPEMRLSGKDGHHSEFGGGWALQALGVRGIPVVQPGRTERV